MISSFPVFYQLHGPVPKFHCSIFLILPETLLEGLNQLLCNIVLIQFIDKLGFLRYTHR